MKCNLKLEILNLHACPGDGVVKRHEVSSQLFSQADLEETESEIDKQLSGTREKASVKTKKRTSYKPLFGFKEDHTYKLGGNYGKLAGLFKASGKVLWSQKTPGFTKGYKTLVKSMIIKPMNPTLNDFKDKDIQINSIPQITAGRSSALIIQYYEYIPKCTAEVEIQMPDDSKKLFEKVVEQACGMPFGPKSRGEFQVLDMKWN